MKLQNTLKTAIAAAMLGSAMQAGAAINPGSINQAPRSGELFLSVWDTVNQVSYVRDLGITFASWMTGQANIGHTFTADSLYNDISHGTNTTGLNDSTRLNASVVGTPLAAFSNTSKLLWNITANNDSTIEVLSTSKAPLASIQSTGSSFIDSAAGNNANYAGQNNALQVGGTTAYAINTSNVATVADGNAYSGNPNASDTFGGIMPWSNAALSTPTAQNQMKFYFLATDPVDPVLNPALVSEAAKGAYWSFDGATGSLVYAVPEAETWALFGAGLMMLGGIARRKRSI